MKNQKTRKKAFGVNPGAAWTGILGAALIAQGAPSRAWGADAAATKLDWDQRYKDLCAYDSWCQNLKNNDGSIKQPKKEVLEAVRAVQEEIRKAAKDFGVDPRAVAGAIVAENSLNVQISDAVQDFLVKYKIAPKGEILGKKFTFGWGQLNLPAAKEAEVLMAKVEGRKMRSDTEISEELLKPASAVRYVAAVMRKVQDDYAKEGIDISKKPEILATLYNLGKSESKAVQTRVSGRDPRVNYFGYFVQRYNGQIEGAVGYSAPATAVASAAGAVAASASGDKPSKAGKATKSDPASAATLTGAVSATNGAREVKVNPAFDGANRKVSGNKEASSRPEDAAGTRTPAKSLEKSGPKALTSVLSAPIELAAAPPTCSTMGAGKSGEQRRYDTVVHYASLGIVEAGKRIEVLSPGLGCGLEPWSLVRTETGAIGWGRTSVLEEKSRREMRPVVSCAASGDPACESRIKEALGKDEDWTRKSRSTRAGMEVPLSSGGGKIDIKRPQPECVGARREADKKAISVARSAPVPAPSGFPAGAGSASGMTSRYTPSSMSGGGFSGYGMSGGMGATSTSPMKIFSKDEVREILTEIDLVQQKQLASLNAGRAKEGLPPVPQWNHVDNPYSTVNFGLNGLVINLRNCVKNSEAQACAGDRADIVRAFDYKVTGVPGYSELKAMSMGFGGAAMKVSVMNVNPSTDEEKKKLVDSLLKPLASCETAAHGLPGSSKAVQAFKDALVAATPNIGNAGFIDYARQMVTSAVDQCRTYSELLEESPKRRGMTLVSPCSQLTDESESPFGSGMGMAYGNNLASFGQMARAALSKPSDRDDYLMDILNGTLQTGNIGWMSRPVPAGTGFVSTDAGCGYDPMETAQVVSQVLKNPCVKAVLVPDPWLVKRFQDESKKVVYRPFLEEDHLVIETGGFGCAAEDPAPAKEGAQK